MCTLTYLLTEHGYEIYFNRDEQRSRLLAIAPQFNPNLKAIYPIDANGQGTWLAVAQSGLCLALLNNYPAPATSVNKNSISRGQLILSLLASNDDVLTQLRCAICLGCLDHTVTTPCLHRFCQVRLNMLTGNENRLVCEHQRLKASNHFLQACIEKWIRIGRNNCPECKAEIPTRRSNKRDYKLDNLVQ